MSPSAEPTATCPACAARIPLEAFVTDGFLRTRDATAGGPYYELECPGEACEVIMVLAREADGRRIVTRRAPRARFSSVGPRQVFPPEPRERPGGRTRRARRARAEHAEHAERPRRDDDSSKRSRDRDRVRPGESALDDAACCALLGVDVGANRDEVLAAFRERSKRMHPDLFASYDEDFQRLAHEKFIQLQHARDRLLARTRGS